MIQNIIKKEKPICVGCSAIVKQKNALPYCSASCKWLHLGVKVNCKNCNKEFQIKTKDDRFCSASCANEYKIINKQFLDYNFISKEANRTNRFKIFLRDNFTCVYCGFSSKDGKLLTLDHVYPVIKGGKNDVFNIVTCCEDCNIGKRDTMLPIEYIISLWETALNKDINSGIIEEYEELKYHFNKKYLIVYQERRKNANSVIK